VKIKEAFLQNLNLGKDSQEYGKKSRKINGALVVFPKGIQKVCPPKRPPVDKEL